MQIITGHNEPTPSRWAKGVAATVGMFDGVHRGHLLLLRRLEEYARKRGLEPLAVTFANHPLSVVAPERAPHLLTGVAARLYLLEQAGLENCLLLEFTPALRTLDAVEFLRELKRRMPLKALVAGFNNRIGSAGGPSLEQAAAMEGIDLLRAEGLEAGGEPISSSRVRGLLENGDVEKANVLLGRCYTLRGIVGHGKELGRRIGFPTANLQPVEADKLLPGFGVYACMAEIEGFPADIFKAVVNIGSNPTVDTAPDCKIEAHILGIDKSVDLYGRRVTLRFAGRLRDERRFESVEMLASQIVLDIDRCTELIDNLKTPDYRPIP